MAAAYRAGYKNLIEFFQDEEGAQLVAALNNLVPEIIVMQNPYSFNVSEAVERLSLEVVTSLQHEMNSALEEFGMTIDQIITAAGKVKNIEIHLDSITSEEIIQTLLLIPVKHVVDTSNIPFSSWVLNFNADDTRCKDFIIMFALNATESNLDRLGVPKRGGANTKPNWMQGYWKYIGTHYTEEMPGGAMARATDGMILVELQKIGRAHV